MRRWKNNPCTCDSNPVGCRAHPFALEALHEEDLCSACGVIGADGPDFHFAGCIDPTASRAPGPQYDVSMLIPFTVHVWEGSALLYNQTHKAYSIAELEPLLQGLKEKYTEPGASRTLRVTGPYVSSVTALRPFAAVDT